MSLYQSGIEASTISTESASFQGGEAEDDGVVVVVSDEHHSCLGARGLGGEVSPQQARPWEGRGSLNWFGLGLGEIGLAGIEVRADALGTFDGMSGTVGTGEGCRSERERYLMGCLVKGNERFRCCNVSRKISSLTSIQQNK